MNIICWHSVLIRWIPYFIWLISNLIRLPCFIWRSTTVKTVKQRQHLKYWKLIKNHFKELFRLIFIIKFMLLLSSATAKRRERSKSWISSRKESQMYLKSSVKKKIIKICFNLTLTISRLKCSEMMMVLILLICWKVKWMTWICCLHRKLPRRKDMNMVESAVAILYIKMNLDSLKKYKHVIWPRSYTSMLNASTFTLLRKNMCSLLD